MRYLLAFTLITLSLTSLNASTFLERFNDLEQDIQSIQDDVENIKDLKGSGKSTPSSDSSQELKSLKETIDKLLEKQKTLESKVKALQSGKNSNVQAVNSNPEEEEDDDDDEIQEQLDEMSKALSQIRKFTTGNHLKMGIDFRTAIDHIDYRMADGSRAGNDAVMSNRLWINMKYKASEKFSFTGQLAYNKLFGHRGGTGGFADYDNFDWITNETANDDSFRLKKAYFFYANETFLGSDIAWTFSLGRRPSTNGHIINLRDDDPAASPLAHSINVEFDGMSSKLDFSKVTGVTGLYLKLCLGRGLSNAAESLTSTPYATEKDSSLPNLPLMGAIVSLYNNGQYSLTTQGYVAKNLIDLNSTYTGFEAVGAISNFTASFIAEGIGEIGEPFMGEWFGNFLDDTTVFLSYSSSLTNPNDGGQMLGSTERQRGHSYWMGIQMPTLSEKGKWGLEYNKGDQYWRPITYAEDTFIGSKIAARGDAYEFYWTEPFANNAMSWQLRFTYIDYKYTGSNGFFGGNAAGTTGTGRSLLITPAFGNQVVDRATDLRFYLRYRY